jgi:hypothetical protein
VHLLLLLLLLLLKIAAGALFQQPGLWEPAAPVVPAAAPQQAGDTLLLVAPAA